MFKKILIANRGEIACRIISTCKRLGIETIAVHSEADIGSKHSKMADKSVLIGPADIKQSYLSMEAILKVAIENNVEAIHPGYGFLSENFEFASMVLENGLKFIGPKPETIRLMGMKDQAKDMAMASEIPIIPGYHGNIQSHDFLHSKALEIEFPILIKPRAGGGGKGMRLVTSSENFLSELEAAKSESLAVFGDDQIILEKYFEAPRHIEVQVFADDFGNYIHTFERECSIQRRYQKLIEEAPAPFLSEDIKERLYETALKVAKEINYSGAGTVEFLVTTSSEDKEDEFFFMEMNTRLQVEHPVSEAITGLDFVELQLDIASGNSLKIKQTDIQCLGHAIESRIYAEDPQNDFLPSIGKISEISFPKNATYFESGEIRLDHGIYEGAVVTPFYDPMIAKLIIHGKNRNEAIRKKINSLNEFNLQGIATNIIFLLKILNNNSFSNGKVDTGFLAGNLDPLVENAKIIDEILVAAIIKFFNPSEINDGDPWSMLKGWTNFHSLRRTVDISVNSEDFSIFYAFDGLDGLACEINDQKILVKFRREKNSAEIIREGIKEEYFYNNLSKNVFQIFHKNEVFKVVSKSFDDSDRETGPEKVLRAKLPGVVKKLFISEGDIVEKGDVLLILEAMKMEQQVLAPCNGSIKNLNIFEGDQVSENQPLLEVEG